MDYDVRNEAIELINAFGLPIIPLCSYNHENMSDSHKIKCKNPGKTPCTLAWSSLNPNRKMFTVEDLTQFFNKNPLMNIGLVLGTTENYKLVAIDIDGDKGLAQWEEIKKNEIVPPTWEFTTGGNGYRLIYYYTHNYRTKKKSIVFDEEHSEISFLCDGQQTVLPPSHHNSGNYYNWVEGRSPYEIELAEAPEWINKIILREILGDNHSSTNLVLPNDPIPQGQRNNEMARQVMSITRATMKYGKEASLAACIARATNPKYFNPPLTVEEIQAAFNGAWNKIITQTISDKEKEEKANRELPYNVAIEFIKEQAKQGFLYKFRNDRKRFMKTNIKYGPWQQIEDKELCDDLLSFVLLTYGPKKSNFDFLMRVCRILSSALITDPVIGDRSFESNNNQNPFLEYLYQNDSILTDNGVYYWKEDRIDSWNPKIHYHTIKYEVDITENIEKVETLKEEWNHLLEMWLPDLDSRLYLQEYIGYCLLPQCSFRTATIIYGNGSNGKSKFIEIVANLFKNASAIFSFTDASDKFGLDNIEDKYLLYNHDMTNTFVAQTGVLKALIAGEPIKVNQKFMPSYTYFPCAKLLIGLNSMPRVKDNSDGFMSRLNIVKFPNKFRVDTRFGDKLNKNFIKDKAGTTAIFCWAIEGLKRLTAQGAFTTSDLIEREKKEYRDMNDQICAFATEVLEDHPLKEDLAIKLYTKSITVSDLYLVYESWCEEYGEEKRNPRTFRAELRRLGYEVKQIYCGMTTSRPFCVLNVKLKDGIEKFKLHLNIKKSL